MLGRLKMTIQECIDQYNNVMKEVFVPKSDLKKKGLVVMYGEAYESSVLETIIKALVQKRLQKLGSTNEQLLDESSSNTCKV
jgi:hypothetical protein